MRMGKIRNPQYRIVVADSRTKRDGRAIEFVGLYHPKEDPSRIEVDSERVQHWLKVGAQPSEPVIAILSKTGDWQKFKGLPAPAEPLKVAPQRVDQRAVYEAEAKAAAGLAEAEKPKKEAPARAAKASRAAKATATAEAAPETAPEATPETVAEAAPETAAEAAPEIAPEAAPETAPEAAPEIAPEAEAAPQASAEQEGEGAGTPAES